MPEFIPYSCQSIDDSDVAAVTRALRSAYLTQGPEIALFEGEFGALHQIEHCVAVCNATAALHIACLALGLGAGDVAWTSPNSFVASANCARYCGAEIDFVDIDPLTRNMSVAALAAKLEDARSVGRLPKVVIPVDFAGLPCDMAGIRTLADEYGFRILEDASHAVGAQRDGAMVGSKYADITVFSFHAVKVVTTAEGGLCATQDADLAQRLRLLASHGITRDPARMVGESEGPWYYQQVSLGYNYRMTDLQAALGRSQLTRLPAMMQRRVELAASYDAKLSQLPLRLPARIAGAESAWHLYAVEIDHARCATPRRDVFERMRAAGIGVNVHYIPIHLQPDFRQLGFADGDFPAAEDYYRQAISLPLFPALSAAQQDRVVSVLHECLH